MNDNRSVLHARPTAVLMLVAITCVHAAGAPQDSDAQPDGAATTTLTGTLHVVWGDPPAGSDLPPVKRYWITEKAGQTVELILDDEGLARLAGTVVSNGERVTATGPAANLSDGRFRADTVATSGSAAAAVGGVYGEVRYATVACRFADSTGTTPRPLSFFEDLMGVTGMNHYWQELSYDNISIDGATVVGWYDLPGDRSDYVYDDDGDGDLDAQLEQLAIDCVAAAEGDVYFPDYDGILLMFNQTLDCCAWGGGLDLTANGVTRGYRMGWFPPAAFNRQDFVGHEMGHSLGLPHSSGPYGATYDSYWDVMSSGGGCQYEDPEFGCIGVHTIAYHKDMLGWLTPSQRFDVSVSNPRTIRLQRLAVPATGTDYRMAKIPIGGSPTHFYTVETRLAAGYDSHLVGEAVIMHEVDTTRSSHALVVDPDGNGDPNDEGAQFLPGESFYDAVNQIVVHVERAIPFGFEVSISRQARNPAYVDPSNTGYEDGTAANPWNTLEEGLISVVPGATVYAAPENYPDARTIRKPLVLRRDGASGAVVLGQ